MYFLQIRGLWLKQNGQPNLGINKAKKVEPEIKNARPDLLFYPSVATNKRGADSGECFF
jgi:hypothetical protein